MKKEESRVIGELIECLKKVRCYTLHEIIQEWNEGLVPDDVTEERLIDWNTRFHSEIDFEGEGENKQRIYYIEFVKVKNVDFKAQNLLSFTLDEGYDWDEHKPLYSIIVNKGESECVLYSNFTISWDTEEERNAEYLLLKDKLAAMFNIRFN